jgi:hypothetical protein
MHGFREVQWKRDKLIYDAIVLACVITYVVAFIALASWMNSPKTAADAIGLRIQVPSAAAFLMLTVIPSIARCPPRSPLPAAVSTGVISADDVLRRAAARLVHDRVVFALNALPNSPAN